MQRPKPTAGLHHVALLIKNLEACVHFYVDVLGMKIVWQPDADNIYLSSGTDNLALHKASGESHMDSRLDHIGFFLTEKNEVDTWHNYLLAQGITIKAPPKDHRDGTRSFYCTDPDGNVVQMIYMPLL